MSAEIAVIKMLIDSAEVGAICQDRIYPLEAPQGEQLPYVIIEMSDNETFDSKSGKGAVDHSNVSVFCYGRSFKEANNLAQACRNSLEHISGTFNSVVVADVRYRGETSFNEEIENVKMFVIDQDYLIRIKL